MVGQNGSGKTTFVKLLCRLYDPTEGEILLNGVDIRKYDYQEYMSLFSIVFQDFKLFDFTLGQNVAAGKRYDRNKVCQCLVQAGFGERLDAMPEGTESYLYKGYDGSGVELSGGEGQKIALARALYKDASFLILDEPTSALDPVSEYQVYSRFSEIAGDQTATSATGWPPAGSVTGSPSSMGERSCRWGAMQGCCSGRDSTVSCGRPRHSIIRSEILCQSAGTWLYPFPYCR